MKSGQQGLLFEVSSGHEISEDEKIMFSHCSIKVDEAGQKGVSAERRRNGKFFVGVGLGGKDVTVDDMKKLFLQLETCKLDNKKHEIENKQSGWL